MHKNEMKNDYSRSPQDDETIILISAALIVKGKKFNDKS